MKNLSRLTALLLALVMLLSITASATEISNYTKADYDADVVAAQSQTEITAPGVLTAEHNGFSFAVEGEVPETAQLYVTHMGDDTAANIRTNILSLPELEEGMSEYAFDITIVNDNAVWQPDTPVEVTINGLDTTSDSFVQVYHIPDSQPAVATLSLMDEDTTPAMTFEEVEAVAGDGTVTFMADGFSVYYVVAGSLSDDRYYNDTFHILRGTSVQLTNVSNDNYSVTYPDGASAEDVSITRSNNTLTFATNENTAYGTYSIRISSSRTETIVVHTPKEMFELDGIDNDVYFTVISDSTKIPNEPMSGGNYSWNYIYKDGTNYRFTTSYFAGSYQDSPTGFLKLDEIAKSDALEQNLQGQNVIGVIDNGWGNDTRPCIDLTDDEWHNILVQFVDSTTVYISDGANGRKPLTSSMVNEKLENGSYRYKMYPYVIKLILASSEHQKGWHVDCAIVDTKTYSVSYEYNLPSSAVLEESSKLLKPETLFYVPGTTGVKVGVMTLGNAEVTGNTSVTIYDTNTMSTSEYKFLHWNTAPDDSGTSYDPTDVLPAINSNVTLYAIWNYTQTTGTLKITKKEVFEDADDERKDDGEVYTFAVSFANTAEGAEYPYTVYNAAGTVKVSGENFNGTVKLKHGEYIIVNNVSAGNVTVTETVAVNAEYVPSWKVGAGEATSGNSVTATVTAGKQTAIECTNTYAPLTGTLTVTKKGLSAGESALFTVTVKVGESIYKTFVIALSAEDNDVTFADLPAGAVCTVAESGDWSWRYATTIYENNGVEIKAGGNVEIKVKNSGRTDKWLSDEQAITNFEPTTTD